MQNTKRKMPADFKEQAANKTMHWIMDHYSCGSKAAKRWIEESGVVIDTLEKMKKRRANFSLPPDFAEIAKQKYKYEIPHHYGVSPRVVSRWAKEAKITSFGPNVPPANARIIPEDFKEMAAQLHLTDLSRHYNCAGGTVKRWCRIAGVEPKQFTPAPRINFNKNRNEFANRITDLRQHTMYDRAADTLRRERWVVYPCDKNGAYTLNGKFWRIGSVIATDDELLQRAEKYRRKSDGDWKHTFA